MVKKMLNILMILGSFAIWQACFSMAPRVTLEPFVVLKSDLSQLADSLISLAQEFSKPIKEESTALELIGIASIWPFIADGKKNGTTEIKLTEKQFVEFYKNDIQRIAARNPVPSKPADGSILRIVSYNVNFWRTPDYKFEPEAMMAIIEGLNPDIIILENVLLISSFKHLKDENSFYEWLKTLGYIDSGFAAAGFTREKNPIGNALAIKHGIKTVKKESGQFDTKFAGNSRSLIKFIIELPNKERLSIYGSLFEKQDPNAAAIQVIELLDNAQKNDPTPRKIIAADFKSVRQKDYNYQVHGYAIWNDLFNEKLLEQMSVGTKALEIMEKVGYENALDKSQKKSTVKPFFTNYFGIMTDFFYVSPRFDWPVDFFVMYTDLSSHLPIVLDVHIPKKK